MDDQQIKNKDKNKSPLDVEFVKSEEEEKEGQNVDDTKTYSFIQMFRYSTKLDRFLLFIGTVASLATGGAQPLNAIYFGDLTESIIIYSTIINSNASIVELDAATEDFMASVRNFALMNSLIGVFILICSYISIATFNYTTMRQVLKIRSLYLQKILNQDVSWYDMRQTGDFASKMSEDIYKYEDGIGEKIPMFMSFQATFIVAMIVAFVRGWELALICLTSLPASLIALGIVSFISTKLTKKELDAYSEAGTIAEEALSAIRTVVAFGGQEKEATRYDEKLVFARKNNIRRSLFTGLNMGILWFIIYASYGLALWYGIGLILRDKYEANPIYTVSTMITVFFSVMNGSMSVGMSSPYIEAFGISRGAGSKLFTIIDKEPVINLSKGKGQQLNNLKGNITFKKVDFHYPSRKDVPILKGLDLEISSGEIVGLVGGSGCGKSTVVQLIQRFYDPISGEIQLDGKNLNELDLTWLRNNIGVVGQEPVLFGTTIRENIKYGFPAATDEDIIKAAKGANAHIFIKKLPHGYDTLVGERGTQLSGGQKQRIAIARALVRNPSILLLDEATSALDNASEKKVQEALDSASKKCTTIIVAHRLSTIRGANKIVVLSEGKVVEQGTHDKLMSLKSEYYKLVTAQVQSKAAVDASGKNEVIEEVDEDDFDDEQRKSILKLSEEEEEETQVETSFFEIVKLNAPEWKSIVVGSISSAVIGCSMPVFSILFGDIMGVLNNPDEDYVRSESNKFSGLFVAVGGVMLIVAFLQIYLFGVAGENMTARIRSQLFRAMLKQEIGFFDRKENGVGAICAKLSGDASNIQGATGQRVGSVFQNIATLFLALGLSLYYEWKLGLLTAAFAPLMIVVLYMEIRNTEGLNDKRDKTLQAATKIAVEAVGNVRTVASLCLEPNFHKMYMEELIPLYKISVKTVHWRGAVFGLSRSIMFFAYSACMFYGGYLIKDGVPYDRVFKVSQALILGTMSIASSLAFTPNFSRGLKAARNVKQFLSRIPGIQDQTNATRKPEVRGNVQYSNIYFSYPTRKEIPVLKGLDLQVLQGKTVALVGESGCGKSTIIQLIERFYDPDRGDVSVDNENIKNIKLSSLRSHLGIVSQEPNLFSKTIAENIAYGDNCRILNKGEIINAAKSANIHNFISSLPLGYETKLGEKGTQLSGGQKQRIAIARALVRDPKILLLDEATSALDIGSEKIVQEALDSAKVGRTCITIAHRLTTIQDADLICVIDRGTVAESGTHKELLEKNGLYYRLQTMKK
uniref:ABC-type xenobiotic transporter n=1 Tax=Chrysochus auratus TaxID=131619 RepID=A0A7G2A9Y0_CHRAA|nr:ABCB transporter [Chrysochus auratus]